MTREPDAATQLFVVDCYDASGRTDRPAPIPSRPVDARLAYVVRVPADDLVQALVEGADEESVHAALTAAGWRVDRITPATWARQDDVDPSPGPEPVHLAPEGLHP